MWGMRPDVTRVRLSCAAMAEATQQQGAWAREATDLVRAVSGGLLFGIPLLFTMEVWWLGTTTEPGPMFAVLGLTFVTVLVLNRTSGFRSTKDIRLTDAAMDAVEAVALGAVSVLVLLVVLHEVDLQTPLREVLGKVTYEAMPFGIGIALAHHFLRKGRTEGDDDAEASDGGTAPARSGAEGARESEGAREAEGAQGAVSASVADLGATVIGAVFVAFNIAPTDEVPMLAARMGALALGAVVVLSLLVSFAIVFVAGFANQDRRHQQTGMFQRPFTETVMAYVVSLVFAGLMLWFFQRLDLAAPWNETVSNIVILGLPASVGGAAGRLAV